MKSHISLLILSLFALPGLADSTIFTGTVRHANTYQEIADTYVYINQSKNGTISKTDGSFTIIIPDSLTNSYIIFEHISYDSVHIPVYKAHANRSVFLTPRVIQHATISVLANRDRPEIVYDLPQPHTAIKSAAFDNRGYIDAGDLLRTNQSIQVEEELSGKKTVAIRAGNPDDVLVMYDGVKLNNVFDNVFDVSLVNLEDIKQFEIIRGSNTSLYGPEAFSGVINIVPKFHKNYTARFKQRIGSYASGDWGLQFHHAWDNKIALSYSLKKGASKRAYAIDQEEEYLKNQQENHFASMIYDLSSGKGPHSIKLLYLHSDINYDNTRYEEELNNQNRLLSFDYVKPILKNDELTFNAAYKKYDTDRYLYIDDESTTQQFYNKSYHYNIRNKYETEHADILLAGQFEETKLNYKDKHSLQEIFESGVESSMFNRRHYGFVSITKFHVNTNSRFLKMADIDFSYRFDEVQNKLSNIKMRNPYTYQNFISDDQLSDQIWSASTYKFSSYFVGFHRYFAINAYLNYGRNVKFPTLFQQISSPRSINIQQFYSEPNLNPEESKSIEIGLELSKELMEFSVISGWHLNFNYFQNYFENKLRTYYMSGNPIAYYDNVPRADITGLETNGKVFLFSSKLRLESGISHYSISEKAAFPFKSEWKFIGNLFIEHAGYSFQVHGFREGTQAAWLQTQNGEFWEVNLPGFVNLDMHLSKIFDIGSFKLTANISVRNLLIDDTKLEGIALRDRRYYLSFGIQY